MSPAIRNIVWRNQMKDVPVMQLIPICSKPLEAAKENSRIRKFQTRLFAYFT